MKSHDELYVGTGAMDAVHNQSLNKCSYEMFPVMSSLAKIFLSLVGILFAISFISDLFFK